MFKNNESDHTDNLLRLNDYNDDFICLKIKLSDSFYYVIKQTNRQFLTYEAEQKENKNRRYQRWFTFLTEYTDGFLLLKPNT